MKQVVQLLNDMREASIISDYALFGAAAQIRYTEAVATFDADILIILASETGLDVLRPIYAFCESRGFVPEGEAIRVGAWPVQFIPAFSALTREAVAQADTADFEGLPFRVVRATHLAVIALSVGRAKDHARILALLESAAVTTAELAELAQRHGLREAWDLFTTRFLS